MHGASNHNRPTLAGGTPGVEAKGEASRTGGTGQVAALATDAPRARRSGNFIGRLLGKVVNLFARAKAASPAQAKATAAGSRLDVAIRNLAESLHAGPGKSPDLAGKNGASAEAKLRKAAGAGTTDGVPIDLVRRCANEYVENMPAGDLSWLAIGIREARATFRLLDCPHLAASTDALWTSVLNRQKELGQID